MNAQELMAKAHRAVASAHSGLIAAFSFHLVKPNLFPIELGRSLNKTEDLRLVADYKGDSVSAEEARWAVQQAQAFVDEVEKRFMATGC